jgi:actin-related protein 9
MLIASHHLTTSDKERITKLFFEEYGVPAFAIYDAGILGLYAAGVLTGITVDIGYEKTGNSVQCRSDIDITPVVEGQLIWNGQISVPLGGKHATQHLLNLLTTSPPASATTSQLLPPSEVTLDLAEEIKLSSITELTTSIQSLRRRLPFSLNGSSGESTPLGTPDARDEGVDDIAQIVASGRMQEYFEKKEREKAMRGKKGELIKEQPPPRPNAELAHNTMTLKDGTSILVGSERFRVAEPLMEGISDGENMTMSLLDAVMLSVELACRGEYAGRRADLWQHMMVIGGGARIKGISHLFLNSK